MKIKKILKNKAEKRWIEEYAKSKLYSLLLPAYSPFKKLSKFHSNKSCRSQRNNHSPIGKRERDSPEGGLQKRNIEYSELKNHRAQDGINEGPVGKNSQGKHRNFFRAPVKGIEHQGNYYQGKD
jgi:hypothetical protein